MLADIPQLPGFLSVIFRLIETRRTKSDRNCLCSKPNRRVARLAASEFR